MVTRIFSSSLRAILRSCGIVVLLLACCWTPQARAAEEGASPAAPTMTLYDAVMLAIRNNRSVKSAYLDRVVQKFDLKVAEDEFYPNLNLLSSYAYQNNRDKIFSSTGVTESGSTTAATSGTVAMTERIPTGADLAFSWAKTDATVSDTVTSDPEQISRGSSWSVTLSQPLLKGGGIDVATASLRRARIDEQQNVLNLKSTLIATVDSVITAYRTLLQAGRQAEISGASLARSRALLEKNKLLIKVGRMAAQEIVQAEADVARNELAHQQALNSLRSARLNLISVLDIDRNTQIRTDPEVAIKEINPSVDECMALAKKNRPDYLGSLLEKQGLDINLMLARNNRLWDLKVNGSLNGSDTVNSLADDSKANEWKVGVTLEVPLYGDLTREQAILRAETDLKKYAISQQELDEQVAIEVEDAIRDLNMKFVQMKLARQARTLSEKQLAIEQEKLDLGMTTNFQLVQFQNDLVSAQTSELDTKISYLNALTRLDQVLGTTLDTWRIDLQNNRIVPAAAPGSAP